MQITFNDRLTRPGPVTVIGELAPMTVHGSEDERVVKRMKTTEQGV